MSIKFFDTKKRKKVEFIPLEDKTVRMYNCGPTVYDLAHIGNFRANIFADLLRRWLEVKGFEVHQIMNLTDVDDKTIRRSQEEKLSLEDFTAIYIKSFFDDLDMMNIQRAEIYPRATRHIEEMVSLIKSLLEKKYAYYAEDGSIYFSVAAFPDYGNLSGKRLADLQIGERVSSDEYDTKDDVRDFALWKAWDEADGDVFWETELGKGRPGWHIECSAMSSKYLGNFFDIHTGGVDNIFPHHENELAQSRCATGDEFVNYWMHCEYLVVEGKKMSKSLGNFYTLRDLVNKGHKARAVRYILAGTHYRSPLNFTMENLEAAKKSLSRIDDFRNSWESFPQGDKSAQVSEIIENADKTFTEAMDDDLNVSRALAAVFNLIREINGLSSENKVFDTEIPELENLWEKWNHALGFLYPFAEEKEADIDEEWINAQIQARIEARKNKNWALADQIRDDLYQKGIELKDSPQGTIWKRI